MSDDLFASVFASVTGAASAVPVAMAEWCRVLMTQGAAKIAVRLAAQDPCSDPTCTSRAYGAVRCLKCQRIACLHHAFLGPTGDGICLQCSGLTFKPAAVRDHHTVLAAFGYLGLDVAATHEAAKKHVQQMLVAVHPDRQKEGTKAHKDALQKSKDIGTAFAVIKKARGWT